MQRQDTLVGEVRRGAYLDSIVLMELQVALAEMDGVLDTGAVMATRSNLGLLADNDLLFEEARAAREEDLVIAVRAEDRSSGERALAEVDALLQRRRTSAGRERRPSSLAGALRQLPEANWVLISVPGRYAARVARDALDLDLSVFLYSDNVSIEDEVELKRDAERRGLLVLGPDCGTALVRGDDRAAGFGFVNRVRRGPIGLVGASGTGLQAVSSLLHQAGSGVSWILGTGGRDLDSRVGAVSTLRALERLRDDSETEIVVLVSKPPAREIAERLLEAAAELGKPVVVHFQGWTPPRAGADTPGLGFGSTLQETAELALRAAGLESQAGELRRSAQRPASKAEAFGETGRRFVSGLFSGGTLALETLLALRGRLEPLASNLELDGVLPLASDDESSSLNGHRVLDLGADEYTIGRLHPMIDFDLRVRALARAATDPTVGLILLDVVLGDGAHPDPASALEAAVGQAAERVEVVTLVVGTDDDPQDAREVCRRLQEAGASVFRSPDAAWGHVLSRFTDDGATLASEPPRVAPVLAEPESSGPSRGHRTHAARPAEPPVAAINLGLELFYDSLRSQGVEAVHVDWRPPAGGNQRLMDVLEKMKSKN